MTGVFTGGLRFLHARKCNLGEAVLVEAGRVSPNQATDPDAANVQRVLNGDLGAFEAIVERWQQRILSLAWRFCRDRAMAEDMAQEVFLKAYRSLGLFRRESAFSTWLTSIALNTFRSRIRTDARLTSSLDPDRTVGADAGAEKSVQDQQRDEAVRRAVLTLPERYRDAILIFYFEEMDLAEAARVLDVAEGTLKARLHRGRELLKRKVERL